MKRKKRYADGGMVDDEIIVEGMRPQNFDLEALSRARAMGPSMPSDGGGGMSTLTSTSRGGASQPANTVRFGKVGTVAGPVYGAEYQGKNFNVGAGLGRGLMGRQGAPMFGANANFEFAKGGKVKNKPVKKMAKGGSTASKRADGCATKGKTKGRFV
jgi:hypothetical protein